MLRLLAKPWEFMKALFGLALPMFRGGETAASAGGSLETWAARGVLIAVILGGLAWLNQWQALNLTSRIQYGPIRKVWLPLFAFCTYVMVWLGWLLYRIMNIDVGPVTSEFPDIDRAWSQALEALARADIHLEDTPLFLVLGSTAGGEEPLFQAAGFRAQVKQVPRELVEPLHVTANRDAIWVSCPGASVIGHQNLLIGAGESGETLKTLSEGPVDPFKTMGASAGETMRIEDFAASLHQAEVHQRSSERHKQVIDSERDTARIRYLCRLIARDRQGFCPINGILIVLPITAADPNRNLDDLALACRADLAEAFQVLPMRCPVLVLVSDLERLQGFVTLIERLPAGQAGKRMGQRFPLAPDLGQGEVPARIEDSITWIGNTMFPSMVYSLFKVESPGGENVSDLLNANAQLYRFLAMMRDRHARIARLVKDSMPGLPREPILFGGCYFAATGVDAGSEQAFTSGVLKRLIDDQDHVTWTSDYISEDASYLKLARVMKVVLSVIIVIGIVVVIGMIAERLLRQPEQQPVDSAYSVDRNPPGVQLAKSAQGSSKSRSCLTVSPEGTVTSGAACRPVASFLQKTRYRPGFRSVNA
jgi:IcmF-related N-terminal domain